MEALQAKKRQENAPPSAGASGSNRKDNAGYDSETSMNSAEFVRNQADNDFIDTEGDDADALNELYAEQHFDDDDAEAMEDRGINKKKISGVGSSRGRSERQELEAEADEDNPIMQAVNKMKRKKKTAKKFSELEDEAKPFLARMERAADLDEEAVAQKRPALKKLQMLTEVCDMLARRDISRVLLDMDILAVCKRWIQPLPDGSLGNVTVRQRLLQAIGLMEGENGITPNDLKRSEFGKVVMTLAMHKDETPNMKRQLRGLIEKWSRPIFQKSGNMRDLERVHQNRGATGLAALSRMHAQDRGTTSGNASLNARSTHRGGKDQDLNSLIKSGSKGKTESGINRVRVPFSKGFQYSVRPQDRVGGTTDRMRTTGPGGGNDKRSGLSKRMLEKGRKVAKNQRSANISIEGRATKG